MRLAEPESIASEQMVTLSQAIRREIVSMGDGIERALARAGELETLVRSEVSNLERSYSDNERRIRTLVEELSTERETMLTNSERMRNAIGGAQDSFRTRSKRHRPGLPRISAPRAIASPCRSAPRPRRLGSRSARPAISSSKA